MDKIISTDRVLKCIKMYWPLSAFSQLTLIILVISCHIINSRLLDVKYHFYLSKMEWHFSPCQNLYWGLLKKKKFESQSFYSVIFQSHETSTVRPSMYHQSIFNVYLSPFSGAHLYCQTMLWFLWQQSKHICII